jgi:hypothetical protein
MKHADAVHRDRRVPTPVAAALAAALLLAGCGQYQEQVQEQDLCTQVAGLREAAAQVQRLDPATATAADVRVAADGVLAQLNQLQATSEGRYDVAISMARAAVTDLREAAVDLGDTKLAAARPLLEDSATDAVTAYRSLQQRVDAACGAN